jgi:hypothetical protein
MSQYIKRTDALRIVDLHYGPCSGYNEIKGLPAEDVAPVVHGQWQHNANTPYSLCSCCGKNILVTSRYNYCPNCGARMDGEVK